MQSEALSEPVANVLFPPVQFVHNVAPISIRTNRISKLKTWDEQLNNTQNERTPLALTITRRTQMMIYNCLKLSSSKIYLMNIYSAKY